jgi:YHS domain-containing protein
MAHARDIVEPFFRAFYAGDTHTARRYLRDDLSFSGPAASFASADDYLRASHHVGTLVRAVETRKVFADGADVCVFYDLLTNSHDQPISVAEWYHLEDDKIASIRTIFDTGPFLMTGPEEPPDSAVDPVCHMAVARASAPATRSAAETTYYFCSPGCAAAFDAGPERYTTASARP